MNVSRVARNTGHQIWCSRFLQEQNKTTHLVREVLKKSSAYNPFGHSQEIDNILKRYERSFWG